MVARAVRTSKVFRGLGPAFFVAAIAACSGATTDGADESAADLDTARHKDAGNDSGTSDGGSNADSGDGNPTRKQCTNSFGSALSGAYGRLDGYLVSIVAPGGHACSADSHHVHLQVLANGAVYDIAVNADSGFYLQKDAPLPHGAWSEGWHTSEALDYPGDLGVHSGDFQTGSESAIASVIENALTQANHVSIFGTPYNHSGAHLIHRQGSSRDGAVVFDPLSPTAHLLLFHFSNQSF